MPGYCWREGEAGRFKRGGGEGLRSHICRIFGTLSGHVTSTTRTWLSLSLREQRRIAEPRHGCVAGIFELGDFSGRRKPRVSLRVAVCLCGGWSGLRNTLMTSEH